ncbi:MAG: PEGA domain-containing protein [Planctomycetes bacterium]|nr:PEGA domain-containing protein [Planctomycetota bacterium]
MRWPGCAPLITVLLLSLSGTTGCVERLLEVRSDPPGATVYVNGDQVGTTPLDHRFTFYGTVEVALRSKGHLAHRELKRLSAPWYQVFPLDFASELLWPFAVRDVHRLEARLEPTPPGLEEGQRAEVQRRAGDLRRELPAAGSAGGAGAAGGPRDETKRS